MRMLFSYFLLLTLALSGLSGSVQTAHAYTLADALSNTMSQQQASDTDTVAEMPCHSVAKAATAEADHDCCDQMQQQCEGDCCAKHCATTGALLIAELFRYIRPANTIAKHSANLPQWLFAEDPPPPINA